MVIKSECDDFPEPQEWTATHIGPGKVYLYSPDRMGVGFEVPEDVGVLLAACTKLYADLLQAIRDRESVPEKERCPMARVELTEYRGMLYRMWGFG